MKPGKGAAALIVAGLPKGKKADEDEEDVEVEDDELDEGKMAAAEEAMAAMQDGDAEAFGKALQSFVHMCKDY